MLHVEDLTTRGQPARSKIEMEPAHGSPNGRARPKAFEYPEQTQVLSRAALEWAAFLTDAEFKVVVDLTGWLWTGLIERISQD